MTTAELDIELDETPTDGGSESVAELQAEIAALKRSNEGLRSDLVKWKQAAKDAEQKLLEFKAGTKQEKKSVETQIEELRAELEKRDRQLAAKERLTKIYQQLSKDADLVSQDAFVKLYAEQLEGEDVDLSDLLKQARRETPFLFKAARGSGTQPGGRVTTSTEKPKLNTPDDVSRAYRAGEITLEEAKELNKKFLKR